MQLRTSKSIEFFHEVFKRKFNFFDYISLDEPTLFFGVYNNNDRDAIKKHKGKKIVWFGGSDSLMIKDNSFLEGVTVVSESEWICRDLDKLEIKYESISLFLDDLYAWRAEPLGKSLYWYSANNSKYGKKYLSEVRKAFPDLNIIIHDNNTVPKEEMPKIYADCFAGVRPVEHDGMSQTVCEMGLMGRMSIWNMKTPFSVPFEGVSGLIQAIKVLKGSFNPFLISKRCRIFLIEQEAKWADLVLRLCGTEELEVSGVFHEDVGRCGSIFRIMKREMVEKMPNKFGLEQMERFYISEQLQKLGLKQFITSKNSGFIATEFKSLKNKGYPEGFKDFRTYSEKYG